MFIIPEFNTGNHNVQTYKGTVEDLNDALLVLEGTRLGILPNIKRRLNTMERKYINANSVFAWNETECGMKRWTDGKNWSASKVSGPFLTYRELDNNKNFKINGLIKQSFSLITKQNQKLHLISYVSSDPKVAKGTTPTNDSKLNKLSLDSNIYQDRLINYDREKNLIKKSESVPNSRTSSIDYDQSIIRPSLARLKISDIINKDDTYCIPSAKIFNPNLNNSIPSMPIPTEQNPNKKLKLTSPSIIHQSISKTKSPIQSQPHYQLYPFTLAGPKGILGLSGYNSHYSSNNIITSSPTLSSPMESQTTSYFPSYSPTNTDSNYTNTYNSNDSKALNVLNKVFLVK